MGWEKGEGEGLGGERGCAKVYVPWPRSPRNSPLNGEAWARNADSMGMAGPARGGKSWVLTATASKL